MYSGFETTRRQTSLVTLTIRNPIVGQDLEMGQLGQLEAKLTVWLKSLPEGVYDGGPPR
jgi:hypothetical protein